MRPTERWVALAGSGVVLLVAALVANRPLPLVGSAVIGGICLVAAARAVTAFTTTEPLLSVQVDATPERLPVGGETVLSIDVSVDRPLTHRVDVEATFPPGVDQDAVTLTLPVGETTASRTVSPTFRVAGRFTCPTVHARLESPGGFFSEEVPVDAGLTLTAETGGTSEIHVGAGGMREGAFGSHESDDAAARGHDLASIREYEPGDSARRIDWKATARLDEPHVREYETELERTTRLVVDARSHLVVGPAGETKLDLIREVGLDIVRRAELGDDPLALTLVDDNGIRAVTEPTRTNEQYRRVRETLLRLGSEAAEPQSRTKRAGAMGRTGPSAAYQAQRALAARGDDSTFTRTLEPFFERTGSYMTNLAEGGLFEAVQRTVRETSSGAWTVLLTDDSDKGRLTEAAKLATRGDGHATVFVTPSALFEEWTMADIDRAYEDLVAFERFRRRLERLPGVTAYEVAAKSRLRAVLARGGQQQRQQPQRRASEANQSQASDQLEPIRQRLDTDD
jgi:uncharacterized protein (DUF58 family)